MLFLLLLLFLCYVFLSFQSQLNPLLFFCWWNVPRNENQKILSIELNKAEKKTFKYSWFDTCKSKNSLIVWKSFVILKNGFEAHNYGCNKLNNNTNETKFKTILSDEFNDNRKCFCTMMRKPSWYFLLIHTQHHPTNGNIKFRTWIKG